MKLNGIEYYDTQNTKTQSSLIQDDINSALVDISPTPVIRMTSTCVAIITIVCICVYCLLQALPKDVSEPIKFKFGAPQTIVVSEINQRAVVELDMQNNTVTDEVVFKNIAPGTYSVTANLVEADDSKYTIEYTINKTD